MSRATALIRFPGGDVRAGIYDGTVDLLKPRLFDTVEDAWTAWSADEDFYRDDSPAQAAVKDVLIYNDYGDGSWWPGKATRWFVREGLDPWEDALQPHVQDGCPDWAHEARPLI